MKPPIALHLPDYPDMDLTAILTPCEEGGFSVRCPEISGAISQGETEEEAMDNIKEATAGLLAMRDEMGGQ